MGQPLFNSASEDVSPKYSGGASGGSSSEKVTYITITSPALAALPALYFFNR